MMQDIETLLKTWPDFNLKPLHAAKVAGWELWATSFDTLTCARIPLVLISVTEGTWGMKALSDYFKEIWTTGNSDNIQKVADGTCSIAELRKCKKALWETLLIVTKS